MVTKSQGAFTSILYHINTNTSTNLIAARFYKDCGATKAWHDARDSLSYVLTDFWFKCSGSRMASLADNYGSPAYVFRYDHVLSIAKMLTLYGLPAICVNRTCHASELPLVFNNYANYSANISQPERTLSKQFAAYWTVTLSRWFAVHNLGFVGAAIRQDWES